MAAAEVHVPCWHASVERVLFGQVQSRQVRLNAVTARCVYGSNIWKDLKISLKDAFGGRSKTAEKLLHDTEKELIRVLRVKAQKRGADALIELRVQFGEMGGRGGSMFYGTAQSTPVILGITTETDSSEKR